MAAGQNLDAFLDLKADSSKKERKKRKKCIYKNHSVILRGLLFHSVAV